MNTYRVWYRAQGEERSEDFAEHLEALSFAHGLLLLGGGVPLDIRDRATGELVEDFSLAVA